MDKPLRILQMTGSLGYAGIETVIMNLYRCIDKEKIQFDFVVSEENGRFDEEVKMLGGNIYRLPSRSRHPFKYYKALKKLLKEHKQYSIFHCNTNSASAFVDLLAAKKAGVKHRILHSHNSSCIVKWQHNIFKHLLKFVVTNKISCSTDASIWMFGNNENTYLLNNGILVDKLCFNEKLREEVRQKMDCSDKFIIGHIGSFQERKNQAFLVDIFAELKIENKELWLIGDGENVPLINQKIKDYNLIDKVKMLGNRDDIADLLQAMDYFVFPSKFEGLSLVLIEAQASGLKCLASVANPKESKVTDNIDYLNFDSIDAWVKLIEDNRNYERQNVNEQIKSSGYDMATEAERLTDYYLNLLL